MNSQMMSIREVFMQKVAYVVLWRLISMETTYF